MRPVSVEWISDRDMRAKETEMAPCVIHRARLCKIHRPFAQPQTGARASAYVQVICVRCPPWKLHGRWTRQK
jgi:hypothetical protein